LYKEEKCEQRIRFRMNIELLIGSPGCYDEVKRLVHSRYLETALYTFVVGLSLSEGCSNSRSCKSLG